MVLLAAAEAPAARVRGALFVNCDDIGRSRDVESAPTGDLSGNHDIERLRDGRIALLDAAAHQDVEYLFADRVISLSDQGDRLRQVSRTR
jgi:hypothetical protein